MANPSTETRASAANEAISSLLSRNSTYTQTHQPLPHLSSLANAGPAIVILTCFDTRIQVPQFLGFDTPGEHFLLTSPGGRVTQESFRGLHVVDYLIGVAGVMVVHHTDCGLTHIKDAGLGENVRAHQHHDGGKGGEDTEALLSTTFGQIDDIDDAVREDVSKLRGSPYLQHVPVVRGFVFDIESGKVNEVV